MTESIACKDDLLGTFDGSLTDVAKNELRRQKQQHQQQNDDESTKKPRIPSSGLDNNLPIPVAISPENRKPDIGATLTKKKIQKNKKKDDVIREGKIKTKSNNEGKDENEGEGENRTKKVKKKRPKNNEQQQREDDQQEIIKSSPSPVDTILLRPRSKSLALLSSPADLNQHKSRLKKFQQFLVSPLSRKTKATPVGSSSMLAGLDLHSSNRRTNDDKQDDDSMKSEEIKEMAATLDMDEGSLVADRHRSSLERIAEEEHNNDEYINRRKKTTTENRNITHELSRHDEKKGTLKKVMNSITSSNTVEQDYQTSGKDQNNNNEMNNKEVKKTKKHNKLISIVDIAKRQLEMEYLHVQDDLRLNFELAKTTLLKKTDSNDINPSKPANQANRIVAVMAMERAKDSEGRLIQIEQTQYELLCLEMRIDKDIIASKQQLLDEVSVLFGKLELQLDETLMTMNEVDDSDNMDGSSGAFHEDAKDEVDEEEEHQRVYQQLMNESITRILEESVSGNSVGHSTMEKSCDLSDVVILSTDQSSKLHSGNHNESSQLPMIEKLSQNNISGTSNLPGSNGSIHLDELSSVRVTVHHTSESTYVNDTNVSLNKHSARSNRGSSMKSTRNRPVHLDGGSGRGDDDPLSISMGSKSMGSCASSQSLLSTSLRSTRTDRFNLSVSDLTSKDKICGSLSPYSSRRDSTSSISNLGAVGAAPMIIKTSKYQRKNMDQDILRQLNSSIIKQMLE